ncbi:MAG: hypothetical protein ACRC9T_03360, partial [Vibrionaceae bacterium]
VLPAVAFEYAERKQWFYCTLCSIVCALLIAFSLYASYQHFDKASLDKSKGSAAYEMKLEQIKDLEKQRDIYFQNDRATLATPTLERLERAKQELLSMPAPQRVAAQVDLIANLTLAVLLELSVFACHVALRRKKKSSSHNSSKKSISKSAALYSAQGFADDAESIKSAAKSESNSLSVDELALLIKSRGQAALTYRELEKIYNISSNKVREVKKFLEQGSALKAVN